MLGFQIHLSVQVQWDSNTKWQDTRKSDRYIGDRGFLRGCYTVGSVRS